MANDANREFTRDELDKMYENMQKQKGDTSAKLVADRQNPIPQQLQDQQNATGLPQAIKDAERSVIGVKFWAILTLTGNRFAFHEAVNQRAELPKVEKLLESKAVLGEYNPMHVISIKVYDNPDVAISEFQRLSDSKKASREPEQMTVEQFAKVLSETMQTLLTGAAKEKK